MQIILKTLGLHGVQLVISDAHAGLKTSISSVLLGAARQRRQVYFLYNVVAHVPKRSAEMVAATIYKRLDVMARMLGRQFPAWRRRSAMRRVTSPPSAASQLTHWKRSGLPTRSST